MARLDLGTVTLCAATSVNLAATIAALRACLSQAQFAECLLLTDAEVDPGTNDIRVVPIARLESSRDYSHFMLRQLADHIRTPHCLVVQWDGFILDASCWHPGLLDFDYVGAPWPQFDDGHDVGNGGFSLRSRKLLAACQDADFVIGHPEDIAICRTNRSWLESRHGIRFADQGTAERFAFERAEPRASFGFHGVFNMIDVLGADRFWDLYRTLDDPSTAFVDYRTLFRQLGQGRDALARRARLTLDRLRSLFGR